jgi:hypothetical protein
MASFGAGNLTHLYLRSSFFGGSGVVSSTIHLMKFDFLFYFILYLFYFWQISEPLKSTEGTKIFQDPDHDVP